MKLLKLKKIKVSVISFSVLVILLGFVFYGNISSVKGSNKVANNSLGKISFLQSQSTSQNKSIADVIEEVSPGVVTVKVNSVVNSYTGYNEVTSIGSGFFISPTKILTNQHVVSNASNITIVMHDGETISAKILNSDQVNDIALLEVTSPNFKSDTVLKLGSSSKMRVGDIVVAIGSPLDLTFSGSATLGIISGLSRTIDTKNGVSTFIQTDAAINPGNSGGPLLNMDGEVIGINTAKINVDGVDSIGFAIPIDFAQLKLIELSKPVINLGIAGVDITPKDTKRFGISSGVFVVEVELGSLANKIGIIPGDIILSFNGVKVKSVDEINDLKKNIQGGFNINVLRNGKLIKFKLDI